MHCVCFSGALRDQEKIVMKINDIEDKSILESLGHGHRIKPGQLNSVWSLLVWFGSQLTVTGRKCSYSHRMHFTTRWWLILSYSYSVGLLRHQHHIISASNDLDRESHQRIKWKRKLKGSRLRVYFSLIGCCSW